MKGLQSFFLLALLAPAAWGGENVDGKQLASLPDQTRLSTISISEAGKYDFGKRRHLFDGEVRLTVAPEVTGTVQLSGRKWSTFRKKKGDLIIDVPKGAELILKIGEIFPNGRIVKRGGGKLTFQGKLDGSDRVIEEGSISFLSGFSEVRNDRRSWNFRRGTVIDIPDGSKFPLSFFLKGSCELKGDILLDGKPWQRQRTLSPGTDEEIGTVSFRGKTEMDYRPMTFDIADAQGTPGKGWDLVEFEYEIVPRIPYVFRSLGGKPIRNFDPASSYRWLILRNKAGFKRTNDGDGLFSFMHSFERIQIPNPTRGYFKVDWENREQTGIAVTYTPFRPEQYGDIARGLFEQIDFELPELAEVKSLYEKAKASNAPSDWEAAMAAYKDIWLDTAAKVAASPYYANRRKEHRRRFGNATVAGAIATAMAYPLVTNQLILTWGLDAFFLEVVVAVKTDLEKAKKTTDPVELTAMLNRIIGLNNIALPYNALRGISVMDQLSGGLPGDDSLGSGALVNQIITGGMKLLQYKPFFPHAKAVTSAQRAGKNQSSWIYRGEMMFRNGAGDLGFSASIHPDGMGVEFSMNYVNYVRYYYEDLEDFYGKDTSWLLAYRDNVAIPAHRLFHSCRPYQGSVPVGVPRSVIGPMEQKKEPKQAEKKPRFEDRFQQGLLNFRVMPGDTRYYQFEPVFQTVFLPYSGLYAMRDNWGPDGSYCLLMGANNLNVGGHGRAQRNGIAYIWRKWPLLMELYSGDSTPTSNICSVAVDGLTQLIRRSILPNRAPLPNRVHSGRQYEFAEGMFSNGWNAQLHQPQLRGVDVSHRRQLIRPRNGNTLIVLDRLFNGNPKRKHEYAVNWQLNPKLKKTDVSAEGNHLESNSSDWANLAIHSFGPGRFSMREISYAKLLGGKDSMHIRGIYSFKSADPAQAVFSLITAGEPGKVGLIPSSRELSGPGVRGFSAALADGSKITAAAAIDGKPTALEADGVKAQASLLVVFNRQGKRSGVALDVRSFSRPKDFISDSFTFADGEKPEPILYPTGFAWYGESPETTHPILNWPLTQGDRVLSGKAGETVFYPKQAPEQIEVKSPVSVGGLYFDAPKKSKLGRTGSPAITFGERPQNYQPITGNHPNGPRPALAVGKGEVEIASPLVMRNGLQLLAVTPEAELFLSDGISGKGDLVKGGDGTVKLSGKSSFSGRIFIGAGTMELCSPAALGKRDNLLVFSSLRGILRCSTDMTIPNQVCGTGVLDINFIEVPKGVTVTLEQPVALGGFTKVGKGTLILKRGIAPRPSYKIATVNKGEKELAHWNIDAPKYPQMNMRVLEGTLQIDSGIMPDLVEVVSGTSLKLPKGAKCEQKRIGGLSWK